jgi:hypothetical protein
VVSIQHVKGYDRLGILNIQGGCHESGGGLIKNSLYVRKEFDGIASVHSCVLAS